MRAFGLRYRTSVCIPYGKRTKINYKVSVTLYLVSVKWYNSIYRYFARRFTACDSYDDSSHPAGKTSIFWRLFCRSELSNRRSFRCHPPQGDPASSSFCPRQKTRAECPGIVPRLQGRRRPVGSNLLPGASGGRESGDRVRPISTEPAGRSKDSDDLTTSV